MKRVIHYILTLFVILSSCAGPASELENFNVEVYSPEYAQGFSILGAEGMESTIIRVTNPWQGADGIKSDLLILRGGEKVPSGFKGQVLDGPAKRVVCMSSTYVAMLDAVGSVSTVVGVSGIHFVTNEYVREHKDQIGDVGYDGNINFELLVALEPDVVLLYGVSGASAMETKLRELKIPYMYVGEYVEQIPLGKSEWLVAISEVVGRRDEGVERFSAIPSRYNSIKEMVSKSGINHPKVMINTPYGDSWFMASTSSYVAMLINDAGGDYLYRGNSSNQSLTIDMEQAAILTSQADVWINVDGVESVAELSAKYPKFADSPCVKAGQVYRNDRNSVPQGGNDYWESGVVFPDVVLADLAKIFYPDLMGDVEYTYYRKLE
ncbi:MAG: ABC transporter substrate-binding protein [Bacteroidales bacterium]|nr:ABC transporter substrate-binding protein [Bacteroidales bacterium]